MKQAPKLITAIAILVLALGVAACGGDDDSNTSASGAGSSTSSDSNGGSPQSDGSQSEGSEGGADDKQGGSGNDEQKATGADDDGGGATTTNASDAKGEDRKRTAQDEEKEAREFKPKTYDDSGGGSKQFRNPEGYDNSIQDYGSETTGSEFEEAATNLHNFYDARAEGNWAATCLYMSAGQIESIETLSERGSDKDVSCAEAVEGLTGFALDAALKEEAGAIDVGSMRTEGDRAFLIYRGLENGIYAMPMAKENGQWKVAGYAGSQIN